MVGERCETRHNSSRPGATREATVMAVRALLAAALLALCGAASTGPARAQEMPFFRIGTGGVAGTYYPIGGLIADIISNPPGARPCDKGGSCGVPGLVAIAQSSNGAVANVDAIAVWRPRERLRPVRRRLLGLYRHRNLRRSGRGREPSARSPTSIPKACTSSPARAPASPRSPTSRASACRWTSPARAPWSTPASSSTRSA